MTDTATIEVRRSRLKEAGWLGAFVLLMLVFGLYGERGSWPLHLGLTGLMILVSLPLVFDTAPRLVIAAEGLSWRCEKKDPLSFLAWSEIAAADIKGVGEDDTRSLRLKLERTTVVQRVASGRNDDWTVVIPIERLRLSEREIISAIHRQAPHLFAAKGA